VAQRNDVGVVEEAPMLRGPGDTLDSFDELYRALDRAARIVDSSRRAVALSKALRPAVQSALEEKTRAVELSRQASVRANAALRPNVRCAGDRAAPPPEIALTLASRVVAVGAMVSVAIEPGGLTYPLLFLPEDFRRLGAEPRLGDRWAMTLGVDLEGATIAGVRIVGLDPLAGVPAGLPTRP
jgi:hypothetical protein